MLIKILVIMLVMALFFVCMVVFGWDVMDYDPSWDDDVISVREKEDKKDEQ